MLTVVERDRRRRCPWPVERAHRRCDGRVHLPHLPLPRADRRVHRGARPDPDRRRRPASCARRARLADRPAADRRAGAVARRACSTYGSSDVDVRLPDRVASRRARRGRAPQRQRAHPRRPAGGDGRRHRLGQDDARPPDRPLRRPDRRASSASAGCRCSASPTRSCAGVSSSCRRSRSCSTTRSRRTSASPSRATSLADLEAMVDRLESRDWLRLDARRADDRGRRARRGSCRRASASSSRCCAPAWPIPTCWCSTRPRRRSTR